jgi:hypothetical protein
VLAKPGHEQRLLIVVQQTRNPTGPSFLSVLVPQTVGYLQKMNGKTTFGRERGHAWPLGVASQTVAHGIPVAAACRRA